MEKIKIDAQNIQNTGVSVLECKDGTKIEVKEHITYDEKEAMAIELAMYTSVTDEDAAIMYDSYKKPLLECALIAKYYTNIDVSEMESEKDWKVLIDWLTMNGVYGTLLDAVENDYQLVKELYVLMRNATYRSYEESHALSTKIKKSFASLLTDDDIAETIAKSEDVNRQMISLLDDAMSFREAQPPKNDKLALDGGAVISLAKKSKTKKNG